MGKVTKKVSDTGVIFSFASGDVLTCDVADIDTDIMERLAIHGISQKVGDSYAGIPDVVESYNTAKAVWNNLLNGLWAVKASRGGRLVDALHRVTGKPLELCQEKVSGMDDDTKKLLLKRADIKKALADMAAEAAERAADVAGDSDDDLNDLF